MKRDTTQTQGRDDTTVAWKRVGAARAFSPGVKERLSRIVGSGQLSDAPDALEEFASDHSPARYRIPALVVKPRSKDEIKEVLELATREGFAVVPVSSGPPHLRGDTVPTTEGTVVMDLRGMNAIPWVDRRNRTAMIEPGVTYRQLCEAVEREGLRISMPLCPKATKSVVAAAWEREPVTAPRFHWDVTDPLACSEFVVGKGDSLFTGEVLANPGTPEEQRARGHAFTSPLGHIQNINKIGGGSQGSLGVCAWASIRCELAPELERTFVIGAQHLAELTGPAFRLLYTRLADDLFILNALDLACLLAREPDGIRRLAGGLPQWVLLFTITGYGVLPDEMFGYKLEELDSMGFATSQSLPGASPEELAGLLRKPCGEPYWKMRLSGDVRELFFQTSVARTPAFVDMLLALADERGFPLTDLGVYMQPQRQGCHCHLEFDFNFPAGDTAARERVEALVEESAKKAMAAGGFFSRPYGNWSDMVFAGAYAGIVPYLEGIKGILDPAGVMSPGRLCF